MPETAPKPIPIDKPLFVWKDRTVKLLDSKTWALSRAGSPEDFDFCNGEPAGRAVAGTFNIGCEITRLEARSDQCLLVGSGGRLFVLNGDPTSGDSYAYEILTTEAHNPTGPQPLSPPRWTPVVCGSCGKRFPWGKVEDMAGRCPNCGLREYIQQLAPHHADPEGGV